MSRSFREGGQGVGMTEIVRQLSRGTFLRVIVASRTPSDRQLPLDRWVGEMLAVILPITGGATRYDGTGYWLNGPRRVVRERVAILDIYLEPRLGHQTASHLVHELVGIASRMEQDALAIVLGHALHMLHLDAPATNHENRPRARFLTRLALTGQVPALARRGASLNLGGTDR